MKAATSPQSLRRAAPWLLVAAAVAYTSVLRLRLIAAGPDADVDAYDHFHIGMRLASERTDITVHWVWLPLWHFVDAAVFALGGGIRHVRLLAVALTAASAFALTELLRRHLAARPTAAPWLAEAERVVPFAAGVAFALWPLNLRGGASAEPEALFQLLLLAAALAWQAERSVATSVALSLAAMLRYEAWPAVAAFGGLWLAERRTARASLAWAMPAVLVAVWCVAHRLATGQWLRFLADNRAYVELAWREFHFDTRDLPRLHQPALWYAVKLPIVALREWAVWLAPGLVWIACRGPRALTAPSLALLATVTVVWVTRRNLGLDRHFAALVPAYATMAAAGLVVTVAWAGARVDRKVARVALGAAMALACVGFVRWRVHAAERSYRRHQGAFVADQAAAEVLRREATSDATVFTTRVPLRVMARLPLERYVGWRPADLRDFNLLVESAHHGEAWVAAPPAEVTALRDGVEVRYRSEGLVLLRRRAPREVDPGLLTARPCR
ncbi:MAG: hypothetical protein U0324_47305 [Polyangiales bacterium]